MALVNITKAALLAGISRTNFHKNYIKRGKISLSRNERGQPLVDTAEILRVFGTLHDNSKPITEGNTGRTHEKISHESLLLERLRGLEQILKAREEELAGYRERENNLYRLLELKTPKKKSWWPFSKN